MHVVISLDEILVDGHMFAEAGVGAFLLEGAYVLSLEIHDAFLVADFVNLVDVASSVEELVCVLSSDSFH